MDQESEQFESQIMHICETDSRYWPDAYIFLRDALDYCEMKLMESGKKPRHVTGKELSIGIRNYALEQFGPMALYTLDTWGIRETKDFGEIVYNMIAVGLLSKTPTDKKEDFYDVYAFDDAFDFPFAPEFEANDHHLPPQDRTNG